MTYSIVARDPETGELGVAVQTDWFAVGAVVPWARPGVGAVATQSFTEVSHGPLGLELMAAGRTAPEALRGVLAADEGEARRQVAMVDPRGNVAAHTGSACVAACGHASAEGVSAQANMMERDTVWAAMAAAFGAVSGPLAERMLAALRAAEDEGGDARGRQSAALVVVSGDRAEPPWARRVDLRVDNHDDPVGELDRLLRYRRAYDHLERGSVLAESGQLAEAASLSSLAHELAPEDDQIAFWNGLILAGAGRPLDATALLEEARAANPRWATYLRRLAESGRFPNDPALLDALLPPEGSGPERSTHPAG
jgi:uncharacterized Ntn-hydrolase superfamily protein